MGEKEGACALADEGNADEGNGVTSEEESDGLSSGWCSVTDEMGEKRLKRRAERSWELCEVPKGGGGRGAICCEI